MRSEWTHVPPTDVARIAAEAVRMDALVAAIAAECDKAEQRSRDGKKTGGLVPAPVLRRLLGEVR